MAKAILICGKICSGKTHYAKALVRSTHGVLLSSDELISALFHPQENDYHDRIIENVQCYLLEKSAEILKAGTDVILDWGFWTRRQREAVQAFYENLSLPTEWHYLAVEEAEWQRRVDSRNQKVLVGQTRDFFVDEGLIHKMNGLFEVPCRGEVDVWTQA